MTRRVLSALDRPEEGLDDMHRKFLAIIRENGSQHFHIRGDETGPDFCYTMGFWANFGFPEIIMFDDDVERAQTIFSSLRYLVRTGQAPPIGARFPDLTVGFDMVLKPVRIEHYVDYLGFNGWFYDGLDFPCLQLFWPDTQNRFPWEPEFEERYLPMQPDLSILKA